MKTDIVPFDETETELEYDMEDNFSFNDLIRTVEKYGTQSFGLVDYEFDRSEEDLNWIEHKILTRGVL